MIDQIEGVTRFFPKHEPQRIGVLTSLERELEKQLSLLASVALELADRYPYSLLEISV